MVRLSVALLLGCLLSAAIGFSGVAGPASQAFKTGFILLLSLGIIALLFGSPPSRN